MNAGAAATLGEGEALASRIRWLRWRTIAVGIAGVLAALAGLLMLSSVLGDVYRELFRGSGEVRLAFHLPPALQPERLWTADLRLERTLAGGGVLSAGLSHRRVHDLIRRRIALETVAEASAPRWVSRPVNLSSARSSAFDLELKGSAPQLLGALWPQAPKALQLRASASWFRSSVEQIDDPDARLDGQPPWQTTLGADWQGPVPGISAGATWTMTPGFRPRQTDTQQVWRGRSSRLDAHLQWRIDRQRSLRLAVNNALAPDSLSSNAIAGSDGSGAASSTRRSSVPQFTASVQWRL